MKWFEATEKSAGKKRLILSYYLYKIFGKSILYIIAFLVSFFTFIFSAELRGFSKKYFTLTKDYLFIKPTLFNQFKHILSYSYSLVDKMLMYSGDFSFEKFTFESEEIKEKMFEDIFKKRGVFFICTHIGNVELFQTFFKYKKPDFNINIFISNRQSPIFNSFLKTVGKDFPYNFYSVEDIDINTGVELKNNLDKGDIVFIAGDRLAQDNENRNIEAKLFNQKILLPKGVFKFAKLMDTITYFISVVNVKGEYRVILDKVEDLSQKAIVEKYTKYMERVIKINPFQFFHFYDFFN